MTSKFCSRNVHIGDSDGFGQMKFLHYSSGKIKFPSQSDF